MIPSGDETPEVHEPLDVLASAGDQLWAHLVYERKKNVSRAAYEMGRLSLALDIETSRRVFMSHGKDVMLSATNEDIARALEDLLQRSGIRDECDSMYEKLIERTRERGRRDVAQ